MPCADFLFLIIIFWGSVLNRVGVFLFHISFFTRIIKILKMSASPIAHTIMLCRGGPCTLLFYHRVAACGVAIF